MHHTKMSFIVALSCLAPLFASAGELPVPTPGEPAHEGGQGSATGDVTPQFF